MNIGINGYEAVVPRFGFNQKTGLPNRVGSSEFVFQLLSTMYKLDKKNKYHIYLPVEPSTDMPKERQNWKYEVFRSKKLWTLLGLSKRLMQKKEKLDVFFSPTHYLPLFTRVPSAVVILDVSYLYFPELFKKKDLNQLKFWGGYSIKKAKRIITISNSSKNDIIKAYGVKPDRVSVVYPGIKQTLSSKYKELNMEELKEKFGVKGQYILFVGTLQPRKNIVRLIEAFSQIGTDLQLVVVGKKGWQYEEILEAPKKYGIEGKVLFLKNVSDEELPSLYKNALCFVLPSLYEGFGLPILEAMQYGCPVLTSNVSSLPEAGGDAALYFNPEDVGDIAKNLKLITENSKLREGLIKKGYEQVKKFSWERSAAKTLEVLKSLAKSS